MYVCETYTNLYMHIYIIRMCAHTWAYTDTMYYTVYIHILVNLITL